MSLKGKVAVITGASRGIGRSLAMGFAAEEAIVVATARTHRDIAGGPEGSLVDTVRRIKDAGGDAIAIPCDVTDEDQVEGLVERTSAEVGRIDVLINNSGIWRHGPIVNFDASDWDRVMAVNTRGPFLMCKYILPSMIERGQGNIINVSSASAIYDESESVVYGPSKAALDRFTLNLALDMKPYNIAVNALAPDLIASAMTEGWILSDDALGRIPSPPEVVVPSAVWLAQQDASTFTGRIVYREEFGKIWPLGRV